MEGKWNLQLTGLYSYYFHSPSWELESRRKAIAFLDEKLIRWKEKEQQREHIIRFSAIQKKLHSMESILPLTEKYAKESKRKRGKSEREMTVVESKHSKAKNNLAQLEMELNYLLTIKENLQRRLAQFKLVKKYLNDVCTESHGQFKSIPDLLDKFNFLLTLRRSQIAKNRKLFADIELGRKTLAKLAQETTMMGLEQQDKLIEMTKKKSQLESQLEGLEVQFEELKRAIITSMVEPTQIKSSLDNLYSQSVETFGRPSETRSSGISQQARFIQGVFKHVGDAQGNPHLLSPEPSSVLPETETRRLSKSRTHTPRKHKASSEQTSQN